MDGNGKIVSLLERIAGGLERQQEETRQLREDMNAGFQQVRLEMNAGFQQVRLEMRAGFEQTNGRIDHAITFLGAHHSDHELRIKALEERVFKKSG
jgi:hypothetical protein